MSLPRGSAERLAALVGMTQIRCRDCDLRFKDQFWSPAHYIYAKCPRCHGTDLTTWNPAAYHIPLSRKFQMVLGGRRRRCQGCRYNFVSFLPVRTNTLHAT